MAILAKEIVKFPYHKRVSFLVFDVKHTRSLFKICLLEHKLVFIDVHVRFLKNRSGKLLAGETLPKWSSVDKKILLEALTSKVTKICTLLQSLLFYLLTRSEKWFRFLTSHLIIRSKLCAVISPPRCFIFCKVSANNNLFERFFKNPCKYV